ncbi:insulin-like growth factor-binding protein complex acid labile subunit [Strongylocentrotus purpuratus]|uniref:TIR domain-containing protein n=1 Tax=Strongylocentrotus purpuratus TaxID=7668 RepID=A0A7M7T337_STRPU|nr:insulin-like growth factor-binding protein complex acid labile subunit [Strongylocentrotus purpuratus]
MLVSTVSRMPVFLWSVGALSLLSGSLPFVDVPRQLGFVSPRPHGCCLKFSDLGTNATCTSLDLRYVPQDLPMNTIMLDLSYNKITTLYNESFVYLIDIISLWVIENRLQRLEEGVFQPLIHLKELSLQRNRLLSLPSGLLSSNRRLSKLYLAGNQLSFIPSSSLPLSNSITLLDLDSNNISTISPHDFSPLENCSLTRLSLMLNALHDLPSRVFSYLKKIDTLSLKVNVLSELHISSLLGNTNIQRLSLGGCKINGIVPLNHSSVTLDGLPTIIHLSLAPNKISSIADFTFWGLNRTNVLDLRFNRISVISNRSFCGLDQMMELDLSLNRLASLTSGTFSCNKMLQRIKLAFNNIASFSTDILSGLPSLSYLDLTHNKLGDVVSNDSMIIPSLEYLDLSYNEFKLINKFFLRGLTNLKLLNVSQNEIRDQYSDYTFTKLEYLTELYLTNEDFQGINTVFSSMVRLSKLDLSFSKLHFSPKSPFQNTTSLVTLVMRENQLKSTHLFSMSNKSIFIGLKSLNKLDLRGNYLSFLQAGTFSPLVKLRILCLSECSIKVLSPRIFSSLAFLSSLYLDQNEITMIPEDLLQRQHRLTVLDISNNEFDLIPRTLFNGTPFLHSLYIDGNKISKIEPKTMFPSNSTLSLDASRNPFSCTCDLSWFVQWVRSSNVDIIHPNDTLCSPSSFEEEVHSPIMTFHPEQYCGINVLAATCAPFAVVLLAVICFMAYRNKWWLNYKIFLLKLAICGYEEISHDFDSQEYEYQLNIMYIEDDEGWVNEVMKPVLQERFPHLQKVVWGDNNLIISMFYINALHYATDNSFKTVLLISYNSIDDAWFLTKLRIALEHLNDTRLDKVILIFLEDIEDDDLPYLVRLFLSRNKPYMLWTKNKDGQELFWAQFEKSMSKNKAFNNVIPV